MAGRLTWKYASHARSIKQHLHAVALVSRECGVGATLRMDFDGASQIAPPTYLGTHIFINVAL